MFWGRKLERRGSVSREKEKGGFIFSHELVTGPQTRRQWIRVNTVYSEYSVVKLEVGQIRAGDKIRCAYQMVCFGFPGTQTTSPSIVSSSSSSSSTTPSPSCIPHFSLPCLSHSLSFLSFFQFSLFQVLFFVVSFRACSIQLPVSPLVPLAPKINKETTPPPQTHDSPAFANVSDTYY